MKAARALEILELPSDANFDQVKHSYKELVFIWHPDRHSGNPKAQTRASKKMTELNEAYQTLCAYFEFVQSETEKDRQSDAFILITCPVCGSKNRVPKGHEQVLMRCGKCKSELNLDPNKETEDRVLCGDAVCTGVIGLNGRCTVCGRTIKEGEDAYRNREQAREQQNARRDNRATTNRRSTSLFQDLIAYLTAKLLLTTYYPYRMLKKKHPSAARPVKWVFWCVLVVGTAYLISAYASARLVPDHPYTIERPSSIDKPLHVLPSVAPAAKPLYVRPSVAPNGAAWPSVSGYVKGYPRKATSGLSTLTVDNTGNDTDVFVKLFDLNAPHPSAVRVFFLKAGGKFGVKDIRVGTYDVRYRSLNSGYLAKSEKFELTEREEERGIRYSNISMTLYKVLNGNMQTYSISEDDFESEL